MKTNDIFVLLFSFHCYLSAVAGAVIQHLIDINVDINSIFSTGYFIVK